MIIQPMNMRFFFGIEPAKQRENNLSTAQFIPHNLPVGIFGVSQYQIWISDDSGKQCKWIIGQSQSTELLIAVRIDVYALAALW